MKRKIGEVFEYKGEWYQCVESTGCYQCAFKRDENTCIADNPYCTCRSDKKNVIFKKLEKVGEPFSCNYYGNNRWIMMQEYNLYLDDVTSDAKIPMYITNYKHKRIAIEIKQTNEDMEENKQKVDKLVNKQKIDKLVDDYNACRIQYAEFDKKVKALYDKEERETTLKPFSLEAAKAGKPVCTRDGRKARIICSDSNGGRPIVALVTECDDEEEIPYKYHCDGSYNCQSISSDNDLMMLTEKKEGWVNVYKMENEYVCENECSVSTGIAVYKSESEAKRNIDKNEIYVNTIKINWEE